MSEAVYVSPTASTGEPVTAVVPLAFEDFVAARSGALWRSAWLLTGDAHKAEDLLQTALLKAWRNWPRIARDGGVEAYVRRALVTTYTDWWRAEVPTQDLPDQTGAREADALGCSVGTVKSQASRALQALRSSPLLADQEEPR